MVPTQYRWPQDILEYINELRYFQQHKEAWDTLKLVAKYIDQPEKLKKLEDICLYDSKYYGTERLERMLH